MQYGQIAGNKSINKTIYRCFDFLKSSEQRKFVNKFNKQGNDSEQNMHTFRELILGAYLSSNKFKVIYEYCIKNKTPDWCILNSVSEIKGIVELTNFHLDRKTENKIKYEMNKKGVSVAFIKINKNLERLYMRIWEKGQKYQRLIEKVEKPYIVSIFGTFNAALRFNELKSCLYDEGNGLFKLYPALSGLLYFQEFSGRYKFEYENNPNAVRPLDIPDGVFP